MTGTVAFARYGERFTLASTTTWGRMLEGALTLTELGLAVGSPALNPFGGRSSIST